MFDLKTLLNNKQYEAATATDKYLRIVAGAGSGKTRVLTYRIAYLIEECGYYPSSILAITFTNKAAQEIRNRVEQTLGMGKLRMNISTIHAFCARVLREDCKCIDYPSNFTVIDEEDQKKIVKDIIKDMVEEDESIDEKIIKATNALDYIANRKNHWISPEDDIEHQSGNKYGTIKATIYKKYEDYLKKNFSLDFDDLVLKTIYVYENYELVLDKWQHRIRSILVDEFQDIDPNQYRLIKNLAGKENEVCVVGDPDQTIYTWRGADVNIILNFEKDFAPCKTISLEQNYRSTGKILDMANRLIDHNVHRIKKNLFTENGAGVEIAQFVGENERKEAEYVIDNINDLYDGKTTFYKDCAVLYRTNAQSKELEQVLMARGIKYKIYGGIRFYRRAEIKDCIAYLRLATNLKDDLSCQRLIENTGRGIGKLTLSKLLANATTENKSIYEHLKDSKDELESLYKPKQGGSLKAFMNEIQSLHDALLFEPNNAFKIFDDHLHKYGYIDMLIHNEEDERVENVKEFLVQIKDYFKDENAKLDEFVQNVTLMSAQDEIEDENTDYVKLMTIHTAKGLEFNNVFIFGLVEEIFPSSRTIVESKDGLEEERRLFYVAITRAKKRLYLSTSGGYSYMGNRTPSRFLKEIKETAVKENVVIRNDTNKEIIQTDIRSGSLIKHDIFGEGIVIRAYDGLIDVAFKDSRYNRKTLNASHKFVHLIK